MTSWKDNVHIISLVFKGNSNPINKYIHLPLKVSEGAYIVNLTFKFHLRHAMKFIR